MAEEPGGGARDDGRTLAAQRRDLEREFEAKMRDLKAQHQRRMDRLKEEQAAWEEHRRQKAQELADRMETARRRTEAPQRVETSAATKQELADLRARVKGLETELGDAIQLQARLQDDVETAGKALKSARARAWGAAGILLLGLVAWPVAGWREPLGLAILAGSVALSALLSLSVARGARNARD